MWTPVLALRDKHNAVEEADKYHTIFFWFNLQRKIPIYSFQVKKCFVWMPSLAYGGFVEFFHFF